MRKKRGFQPFICILLLTKTLKIYIIFYVALFENTDAIGLFEKCDKYHKEELFMNKAQLVAAIAEKANIEKKVAENALKAFEDVVTETLAKGEKVQLVGFGTFETSERAARTGINPQTKEAIEISAAKAPKFKAGRSLKDAVNA